MKREWKLTYHGTGHWIENIRRPYEYAVRIRFSLERDPDRLVVATFSPGEAEQVAELLIKHAAKARELMGQLKQGTKIEYTAGNLGAMLTRGNPRMVEDLIVNAGERGTYLEPYPEVGEPDWHWTVINYQGTTVFVPVHKSMFKLVDAEGR